MGNQTQVLPVSTRIFTHCWLGCKLVQQLWKPIRQFLIKLNVHLPYGPSAALFSVHEECNENLSAHPNLYANIHSSSNCNSKTLKTAQGSFSRCVTKHLYNGILSGNKKKPAIDIHNLDGSHGHYAGWRKGQTQRRYTMV